MHFFFLKNLSVFSRFLISVTLRTLSFDKMERRKRSFMDGIKRNDRSTKEKNWKKQKKKKKTRKVEEVFVVS